MPKTAPDGYDGTTRYPVHYTLHGSPEYPNAVQNMEITEEATAGVPLITVEPVSYTHLTLPTNREV